MATTISGSVESHDNDWTSAETATGRNVGFSLWRGVRGRCPRCGRGRLFCAFLKVDDHCSACRLDFTGHRADDLPAHLVIVIVGHVLVPVILWVRGRLCTVASVSAWHLPSDCGLGLDSSPAAGQGRRRGAAMVAQDARLRRASARRTPGLRRKVRQRNGAREVGASASNFICTYPLNLFRVAKASAWCRASRPHLTSSHRRSAE